MLAQYASVYDVEHSVTVVVMLSKRTACRLTKLLAWNQISALASARDLHGIGLSDFR
jgi:hypothetical protein